MDGRRYDDSGRLVYEFIPETETRYEYLYNGSGRTVTISNEKNRSNHTTMLEQTETGDGRYRDVLKTEVGDVYTIRVIYDELGRQSRYEQINKEKKTNLIKTFHYPDNTETHVFIINYNGQKDFGFKADIKRLTGKS